MRAPRRVLAALLACWVFSDSSLIAAEPAVSPQVIIKDCEVCPSLVRVSLGEFLMGFDGGEPERYEGPVRQIVLASELAIGQFEVTQAQYQAFVAATGHPTSMGCNVLRTDLGKLVHDKSLSWQDPGYGRAPKPNEPVVCISWHDASAYVGWLTEVTGHSYRLLSEAEWEYLAREGSPDAYPWGDDTTQACLHGNVYDQAGQHEGIRAQIAECNDGYASVAPIGQFQANRYGLYDLIGNVWEWVEDCYAMPYPAAPVDGSVQRSLGCDRRSVRGGSWRSDISRQRPTFRGRDPATLRSAIFGLRVARELKAEMSASP